MKNAHGFVLACVAGALTGQLDFNSKRIAK